MIAIDYAYRARKRPPAKLTFAGWFWLGYMVFVTAGCTSLYVGGVILEAAQKVLR